MRVLHADIGLKNIRGDNWVTSPPFAGCCLTRSLRGEKCHLGRSSWFEAWNCQKQNAFQPLFRPIWSHSGRQVTPSSMFSNSLVTSWDLKTQLYWDLPKSPEKNIKSSQNNGLYSGTFCLQKYIHKPNNFFCQSSVPIRVVQTPRNSEDLKAGSSRCSGIPGTVWWPFWGFGHTKALGLGNQGKENPCVFLDIQFWWRKK